jgi:hypothetical protein
MNGHASWRDVETLANRLTESDRRALLLLVHLPLVWEVAIERLCGLQGGASVYRCLARLRSTGLVGELRPALRARRNASLLYLTDLGLATVAADQRVEPNDHRRPSRDAVIRLGLAMQLPLESLDELLLSAGYGPLVR